MMKKQVDIETEKKAIQEPSLAQDIIQLLLKIVIIIFAIILIFTFLYGIARINDVSMKPAIKDGDLVMYYRLDKRSGYPDGLKGNAIPMCAQVVGIVDAYDALINDRPYKRKYEHEEAIRMISNGECGAFSNQLMQCFKEAAKQQNWLKRKN